MANEDPNLNIKITTSSETGSIGKTAEELRKLKGESEKTGEATDKLTVKKGSLIGAFKKLQQEVPFVGTLISALKNPLTIVTIAAAAATEAFRKFISQVNELSSAERALENLNRQQQTFHELNAKAKNERDAFLQDIREIGTVTGTAAGHLKQLNDEIERKFRIEEAIRQRAQGKGDDQAARDDLRKRSLQATALFNASLKARDIADEAEKQLPAAEAELADAERKRADSATKFGREEKVDAARRTTLEDKLKSATADLDKLESSNISGEEKVNLRKLYQDRIDDIVGQLGSLDSTADQRRAVLEQEGGVASRARTRVTGLRSTITTNRQAQADFRAQSFEASRAIDQDRAALFPDNGPPAVGPGSAQFRFDAQQARIATNAGLKVVTEDLRDTAQEFVNVFKEALRQMRNASQDQR